MAHESNLDYTEIICDGNNHLQQPTNVPQMDHTQMDHTLSNVQYNNNLTISHGSSDMTTYVTSNYEESSFADNQLSTSTQYNSPLDNIQFQNNFFSNNSPQTDNSEIFKLNIPGFIIIVIPDSVNLANLDLQNFFQQDSIPNIVTDNSQTHLQNTLDLNDSFDFNNF
jgi:hypothetical protein